MMTVPGMCGNFMVLKHLANMDSQEYSKKTNLSPKTLKEICEAIVI